MTKAGALWRWGTKVGDEPAEPACDVQGGPGGAEGGKAIAYGWPDCGPVAARAPGVVVVAAAEPFATRRPPTASGPASRTASVPRGLRVNHSTEECLVENFKSVAA